MVNSASEKSKIGGRVLTKELNGVRDRKVDKCLSPVREQNMAYLYYYCYIEVSYERIRGVFKANKSW